MNPAEDPDAPVEALTDQMEGIQFTNPFEGGPRLDISFDVVVDQLIANLMEIHELYEELVENGKKVADESLELYFFSLESDITSPVYLNHIAHYLDAIMPYGVRIGSNQYYHEDHPGEIGLMLKKDYMFQDAGEQEEFHFLYGKHDKDYLFTSLIKDLETFRDKVFPYLESFLPTIDQHEHALHTKAMRTPFYNKIYGIGMAHLVASCLPNKYFVSVECAESTIAGKDHILFVSVQDAKKMYENSQVV